jgi:hypothetical protein
MAFAAALDDIPKPVWIFVMILGFIAWWPVGLAVLALMIGSGRLGCYRGGGRWQNRMQDKMDRMRSRMEGSRCDWWGSRPSSGNRAFDDYRAETLSRLEDEQREFKEFLERLRFAKDRAEFDQFMAERRNRPQGETPQAQPQS